MTNITFNNRYYNKYGNLNVVFSMLRISVTLKFTYCDHGCLQLLLVYEGNINMSNYNLNVKNSNPFGILQSINESFDKSHEILSFSADAQNAFKFKEVCKTGRLKSDLADANDKPAHQDVPISDLKNGLYATFDRICILEGVTARQAQEIEK